MARRRTLVSPIKRGYEADVGAVRASHWSVLCRMAAQVRLSIQPLGVALARTSQDKPGHLHLTAALQLRLDPPNGSSTKGCVCEESCSVVPPFVGALSPRPRRPSLLPLPRTAWAATAATAAKLRCHPLHSLAIGRLVCCCAPPDSPPPPHYHQRTPAWRAGLPRPQQSSLRRT